MRFSGVFLLWSPNSTPQARMKQVAAGEGFPDATFDQILTKGIKVTWVCDQRCGLANGDLANLTFLKYETQWWATPRMGPLAS